MEILIVPFEIESTGNLIEAAFWIACGLVVAFASIWKEPALRTLGIYTCAILILFGFSDIVEAHTGAWWRPPWLLAWKSLCLIGLAICTLRYRRLTTVSLDRHRQEEGGAMARDRFESAYQGQAPWDIDGPQPAFVQLEEVGAIRGSVLDAGCGTGENALFLATRGHEVTGIDYIPVAIDRARAKAAQRQSAVDFQICDALELSNLERTFDTVIDCGLFHTFSDDERNRYVEGLAHVVRPEGALHILCFSDEEPPGEGPRRITRQEILDAFHEGWTVEQIRATTFKTAEYPGSPRFSPGGPLAWIVTIRRAAG